MPRICHNIHGVQVFRLLWWFSRFRYQQQPNSLYGYFRFGMPSNRAFPTFSHHHYLWEFPLCAQETACIFRFLCFRAVHPLFFQPRKCFIYGHSVYSACSSLLLRIFSPSARPPRVSATIFTSCICCIYAFKFGQYWTLFRIENSSVSSTPCIQFLFIRPRLCPQGHFPAPTSDFL